MFSTDELASCNKSKCSFTCSPMDFNSCMFSYYQDPKQGHFEDELQQGDVLLNGACAPLNSPFSQDNLVSSVREDTRNTDSGYITNLTEHSTSFPGCSSKLAMSEVITNRRKHISDSTCSSMPLVSALIRKQMTLMANQTVKKMVGNLPWQLIALRS